ncbi:MAG TPA: hypothetical protein VFH49_08690 [Aquabacterium sp.]|nr:hypothetical protein [Aquabacterium sp.]
MTTIHIGIDPGAQTGYAAWDATEKRLASVRTLKIHEAMHYVLEVQRAGMLHSVTFEDARLRTWFGGADARQARSGPGIREGVGSVKRDCTIWAEFLGDHGIAYRAVKPAAGTTKWDAETFAKRTGWTGRTSNHGRDAALLVFGR